MSSLHKLAKETSISIKPFIEHLNHHAITTWLVQEYFPEISTNIFVQKAFHLLGKPENFSDFEHYFVNFAISAKDIYDDDSDNEF